MDSRHPSADHDELLAQLGWMRTLARRLVRDPDVADDVLQRSCLLALQRPAEVAPGGAGLRAWLAAVVRRVAGHRRRAEARRDVREQRAAAPEALPATVDLAARREILRRLVETVTTLDEPGFSTIVRRYYEGRSTLEIAAQDGVSPEVVRQRLQRARARLRERLEASLDPRWLPALALLSPRGGEIALPTVPHPVMRGLLMAERTARPVVWKAAAAAVALALGAGTWYVLDSAADDTALAPVAVVPAAPAPSRAAPALPALPPAKAEPAPVQVASVTPVVVTAPAPAPAPASWSETATWNSLWTTADATVRGTVDLAAMLDTTNALLDLTRSRLAAEGAATIADPTAPLVILDTEGVGRATLSLKSSATDASEPSHSYTFDVELDTQDGHFTGLQQGQPSLTKLSIAFHVDDTDRPTYCSTVVQNFLPPTPELYAHMLERGPQAFGGHFDVSGDGGEWKPLTWEAITDPKTGAPLDDFGFRCKAGAAETRDGSLADPRVATIANELASLSPDAH